MCWEPIEESASGAADASFAALCGLPESAATAAYRAAAAAATATAGGAAAAVAGGACVREVCIEPAVAGLRPRPEISPPVVAPFKPPPPLLLLLLPPTLLRGAPQRGWVGSEILLVPCGCCCCLTAPGEDALCGWDGVGEDSVSSGVLSSPAFLALFLSVQSGCRVFSWLPNSVELDVYHLKQTMCGYMSAAVRFHYCLSLRTSQNAVCPVTCHSFYTEHVTAESHVL